MTDAETLYYLTYNAFLLGNLENAKMYLEFLRDEFEHDEKSFDTLKDDHRWKHLIELGHSIDNRKTVTEYKEFSSVKEIPEDDLQITKEHELVLEICKNADILKKSLNASNNFHLFGMEHETMFGKVDLVGQDKDILYVIEVKKNKAEHNVISQIEKYMIHYELNLIFKLFKKVQGIVIANGFAIYVLKELQKKQILPIKYSYFRNNLDLSLIT